MGLIITGGVLVVVAVLGFAYLQHLKRELHAMIGAETLSLPELAELRKISDELGARGSFRKVAEVVGAAHPHPDGPLTAELSKTECVWFRYRVQREYEHVTYRDGNRHRDKRTETVTDFTSSQGYALIDPEGATIGVDPNGCAPDGTEQTVHTFEPRQDNGRGVELFGFRLPNPFGSNDSTLGYRYDEWVIRPGRRMYVLGEVHDRLGPLVIGKPSGDGHFIVSTRTEDELREERTKRHQIVSIAVIAAFVLGTCLGVAGILQVS